MVRYPQRVEVKGKERNWPSRSGCVVDGGRCLELFAWLFSAVLCATLCVFPFWNPEALSIYLISTIIVIGLSFMFCLVFGLYGESMHRTYAPDMHRTVKASYGGIYWIIAFPYHGYVAIYHNFLPWALSLVTTSFIFVNFLVEGLVLLVIGLPILLVTSGGQDSMKEVWAMKMEDMRERKAVGGTLKQTREYIGWTSIGWASLSFWKGLVCGRARLTILALATNLIAEYWMGMCANMWLAVRVLSCTTLNIFDINRAFREMTICFVQRRRIALWDFESFQPMWDFPEMKQNAPAMYKFMEPQKVQPPKGPEWKFDMDIPEIMPRFPPNIEALKDAPEIERMPGFDADEFMPKTMEPGYCMLEYTYYVPWFHLPENQHDDWIPYTQPFHYMKEDYGTIMSAMQSDQCHDIITMPFFFGKASLLADRVERARQFGRATVMKVRSSGAKTESVGDVIH